MTTDATTAATLAHLNVHFVASPVVEIDTIESPTDLLCGLVRSDESRMRLALIPLLLQYPWYAAYLTDALVYLAPTQQQTL